MHIPLNVLTVSSVREDVSSLLGDLKHGGYQVSHKHAPTLDDFQHQLSQESWHLVLACDATRDQWAFSALEIVRNKTTGLPFIMVSDHPDAETVARAFKAGVDDFVSTRTRFLHAVRRELDRVEQQRANRSLAQHESHYRIIFEHSNDAIFLVDPEKRLILEANPKACDLLGYQLHELLDIELTDVHPDQPDFYTFIKEVMEKGAGQSDAFFCVAKDGKAIPAAVSASGFLDQQGNRLLICTVRDISQRRKTEETMTQLQNQKRLILDSAGEGIYGTDSNGFTTFLNPAACDLLGYQADELIGESMHAMIHHTTADGEAYPFESCPVYRAFRNGETCQVENELFWKKDGTCFPVEYISTPVRNEQGEVTGAVVTFRDVTSRKKAEHDLRASEERFRAIFNTVRDAIFIRDLESEAILHVNDKMCEMFGYTHHQILQLHIDMLSEDTSPEALSRMANYRMAAKNGIPQTFEWLARTREGRPFWVEAHMKRANIGGSDRVLVVLSDITHRKEIEAELERRVQDRTAQLKATQAELVEKAHQAGMADIATSVLHNVGNILTSVSTSGQMITKSLGNKTAECIERANSLLEEVLKKNHPSDHPKALTLLEYYRRLESFIRKDRRIVKENSERIQVKVEVIRDVIMAQQSYALRGFQSESVHVSEVVSEALSIQQSDMINHQINVERYFRADPLIRVQKNKLIHVIVNLLKNASEAMPGEKRINLVCETKGDFAFLRVTDTGEGIEPGNLERIFSQGFTTKKRGHGFGLHSCANAMTEMGGSIWAESEGEGKGATFVLKFTLEESMCTMAS